MQLPEGGLPAYDRPPVVEVALAVQLAFGIGYRSLDLAEIADRWSDTLPMASERPALPPMTLELESHSVAFQLSDDALAPRLWLQNYEGSRLLQLQQDRLVVNWRRLPDGPPYPRYAAIREFLVDAWERLTGVMGDLERNVPDPSVCEVLYVNRFEDDRHQTGGGDMSAIVSPWTGSMSDDFLPSPSATGIFAHFDLPEGRGWLAIEGQSGGSDQGTRGAGLNLVSRGRPSSPDLDGVLDFMDLAHEWIVRGFTSFTTAGAHQRWERTA